MKNKKALLLFMCTVMMISGLTAAGCKDKDSSSESNSTSIELEVFEGLGQYYCDTANVAYGLSLSENSFALTIGADEKSGSYSYDGEKLTLTFADGTTATATVKDLVLTLNYNGGTYRFYKDVKFTVSYSVEGAIASTAEITNGKLLEQPAAPEKDGYVFVGWYVDSAYSKTYVFNATPVTADLTLYARFVEAVESDYEASVKLVVDGEEAFDAVKTIGGIAYVDAYVPTKEGATFAGWWVSDYENGEKLTYKYTNQKLAQNTTLYAVWESNAPQVSVSAEGVVWSAKGVNNQYDVTIIAPDGSKLVDGEKTAKTSYAYDFSAEAAGDYVIEIALKDNVTKVYYKNKALARVSAFKVVDSKIIFNAVENATNYYITVDCGNDEHSHTEVDLGAETVYDFSNCAMQKGGIKFIVKAAAEGYMESVSEEYAYSKDLVAVSDLAVSEDGQQVTWSAVENALSYKVEIVIGDTVDSVIITENSYCIKNYSGEMLIKVTPIAAGYNSPDAAELPYNKLSLAAPVNVRLVDNKLVWDAVEGASKYVVKLDDKEYEASTNEFVLTSEVLGTAESCVVSVKAIAAEEANNSAYSDGTTVRFSTMSDTLVYENGEVRWEPVLNTSGFGVQVNGGEEVKVDASATKAAVVLTKAGLNTIKVRCYSAAGNPSDWVDVEVYAYEVIFDVAGGSAVDPQYKAQGDTIVMPETELLGYNLVGWYNTPNGTDGSKYDNEIKQGDADLVLYAHWAAQKFVVTFDAENGKVEAASHDVYYNQSYQLPVAVSEDVTKTFAGWYTEPNGQGLCYADVTGESLGVWNDLRDRTLYAKWVEIFTFDLINNGEAYSVSKADGISYVTSATIPTQYEGKPVTTVEADAFKSCTKLVSINIPDTIQNINIGIMGQNGAGSAFNSCTKLENINIYAVEGNHERFYESLDGILYRIAHDEDGNVTERELIMYPYARKDAVAVIHEGTTSITASAFKSADFTEITIPHTVTYIGAQAFYMSELVTINFQSAPEGVEEQVLQIGEKAFQSCTDLESITLPARLSEFTVDIFMSCSKLKKINVTGEGGQYKSNDGILCSADGTTLVYCPVGREGVYTIPEGVLAVGESAFTGCKKLTEIVVPNYVHTIAKNAFKDCTGLVKVTFEGQADDTPLTIGEGAFYGCRDLNAETGLTEVTLPANLISLGVNAFGNIKYLTKVTLNAGADVQLALNAFGTTAATPVFYVTDLYLGDNVVSFDIAGVFGDKLVNVVVDENNENLATDKDGVLFDKDFTEILFYPTAREGDYTIPNTVQKIGARVFKGKLGLTKITIPNTVIEIGEEAFHGCTKITVLEFAEGGTESLVIGTKAFYNTSMKELVLPSRLTEIGEQAFYGIDITELVLPEGVKKIGVGAFQNCSYLASVTLPESLEEIVESVKKVSNVEYPAITAFNNCNKLTEITVHANNASYAASQGILYKKVDGVIAELCVASRGATGDIVIPNTVTKIWAQAFFYNENIASVRFSAELPEGNVLTIEPEAFWWCESLAYVELPKGLQTIPEGLFNYCDVLKEIYIPNTVTLIENKAFSGCKALEKVTFEDGTEPLEFADGSTSSDGYYYSVFSGCTSLKQFTFPERTKKIGDYMFAAGSGMYGSTQASAALESIHIPAGVEILGKYMFYQASNLQSITFADGINLTAIPDRMFYKTKITSIVIPESVEAIEQYAFAYTSLTSVVIPAKVKTIGVDAFYSCKELSSVTFADNSELTTIDNYAFTYNSKLTSIKLPAAIESIGNNAFAGCTALASVEFAVNAEGKSNLKTLGTNVFGSTTYGGCAFTEITFPETYEAFELGKNMFNKCTNLETVNLSSTVSKIDGAFLLCPSIKKITVAEGNENFKLDPNLPIVMNVEGTAIRYIYGEIPAGEFVIPEGIEEIDANAFEGQNAMTKVVLPQTLKVLGAKAFLNCASLQEVVFAKGIALQSIGESAFEKCVSLTSVELPEGVTTMGKYLFRYCTSLSNVTIPDSYTVLADYMFYDCDSLKSIKLPSGLTSIGKDTFERSGLESIELPATYQVSKVSLDIYAFKDCKSLKTAILPASLAIIPNQFFNGCSSLTTIKLIDESGNIIGNDNEVLLPTALTEIGSSSFNSCSAITKLILPETFEKFGSSAFSKCYGLKEVTIPGSVTTFSSGIFLECTALEKVVFGDAITDLSKATTMFKGCTALSDVTLPSNATKLGNEMFEYCTALTNIDLPDSLTYLGKMTFAFSGLTEVKIPAGVTQLSYSAGAAYNKHSTTTTSLLSSSTGAYTGTYTVALFGSCLNLEKVILHDKVEVIGNATFHNCPKLKEIGDTSAVYILGAYAFAGCSSLEKVSLPSLVGKKSTTTIAGYKAFADCSALATIELPNLTTMANYMFQNCTALTSMDLSKVTTYGTYSFDGCTALTGVALNPAATKLANYFFSGCTSLKTITLPEKLTQIDQYLFQNSGLESITIPAAVTKVLAGGFLNTNLKTVNITAKISSIADRAFSECSQLQYFTVDSANAVYKESEGMLWTKENTLVCYPAGLDPVEEYVITENMAVAKYAFDGCANIKRIVMSEGLTEIVQYMFYGFAGEEIVIPETVTKINTYAFQNAENLVKIVIPEGITSLPANAFKGATVQEIVLPSTLTELGATAFEASNIGTLVIPEGVTSLPSSTFKGATIGSLTLPSTLETLNANVFQNTVMESIELPDSIKALPNYAFDGSTIKSIKLPAALETIGTYVFRNCVNLASITLPETLTSIGTYSFQGCTSLTAISIPDSVVTLGTYMFDGCTALKEVKLSKSLTSLSNYTFAHCTALEEIELPEGITKLNGYIFTECTALRSLKLPESLVEIGYECFVNCTALKALYIPENTVTFGRDNFNGWTAEQYVYFKCDKSLSSTWNSSWADDSDANFVFNYQGA